VRYSVHCMIRRFMYTRGVVCGYITCILRFVRVIESIGTLSGIVHTNGHRGMVLYKPICRYESKVHWLMTVVKRIVVSVEDIKHQI